jgi:hypothetical protein
MPTMKRFAIILGIITLAFLPIGCEWLRKLSDTGTGRRPSFDGPIEAKSREDLVGYLNRQADLVESLKYPNVKISLTANGENNTLNNSDMICAKPRFFSLSGGKAVMGEVVSIGSNNQEFWMYSRFPQQTYVFCSHDDYNRGLAQLPVPFDAEWVLQTLGMHHYDTNLPAKVENDEAKREHRLVFEKPLKSGPMMKHTVVFAADSMGDKYPQVRRFIIQDLSGNIVASADIKDIVTIRANSERGANKESYVQVPTSIALDWPQEKFHMDLDLRRPVLNDVKESEKASLFSRPTISGITPVNLAKTRTFRR